MDQHTREHLHETPWVVTGPLIALAIPSVLIGAMTVGPVLFGGYFGDAIVVHREHDVLAKLGAGFGGWFGMLLHGLTQLPFWLAIGGLGSAWYIYMKNPALADHFRKVLAPVYTLLDRKYYADEILVEGSASQGRQFGTMLWQKGDVRFIDGVVINGTAFAVDAFSKVLRNLQTGYLYHYAFAMIIGVLGLLTWFVAWS